MNYFINAIKFKYFDFKGRASRKEYWYYVLFNSIISIVLLSPIVIFFITRPTSASFLYFFAGLFFAIYIIYYLFILIPGLAITVRRLHDSGKSGWTLLFALIPYVGAILLIIFYLLPSQKKTNRWGPIPR